MSAGVCVVAGVGPGNGAALSRRFAAGAFTPFLATPPEVLEADFRSNALSLLLLGQAVVPDMRAASDRRGSTSATW